MLLLVYLYGRNDWYLYLIEWYSDLNKNLPVFFSQFNQLDLSKKLSQKTLLVLFNWGTTRLCTSMKFINKTFSLMQTTQYCFSCIWIEKANFKQLACRRGKQTIPIKKKKRNNDWRKTLLVYLDALWFNLFLLHDKSSVPLIKGYYSEIKQYSFMML